MHKKIIPTFHKQKKEKPWDWLSPLESLSFYRKNFLAISVNTVSVYPTASNAYATSASSFSIVCIILPPNFKVYLCLHRPTFPYLKNTVLSAMKYLTSWFGMVQGVSTSLLTQSKKKALRINLRAILLIKGALCNF